MFIFATEMFSFEPYDVSDNGEPVGVVGVGSMHVSGAYLDSWLHSVLRCSLEALEGAASGAIDLVEEGTKLQFRVERNCLILAFGEQQGKVGDLHVVAKELVADARSLLGQHDIANPILRSEIEATIERIKAILEDL